MIGGRVWCVGEENALDEPSAAWMRQVLSSLEVEMRACPGPLVNVACPVDVGVARPTVWADHGRLFGSGAAAANTTISRGET